MAGFAVKILKVGFVRAAAIEPNVNLASAENGRSDGPHRSIWVSGRMTATCRPHPTRLIVTIRCCTLSEVFSEPRATRMPRDGEVLDNEQLTCWLLQVLKPPGQKL